MREIDRHQAKAAAVITNARAPSAAAPSAVKASAPETTESIMSLPDPSYPLGKLWISIRPPDFSFAAAWAHSTAGIASTPPAAMAPAIALEHRLGPRSAALRCVDSGAPL